MVGHRGHLHGVFALKIDQKTLTLVAAVSLTAGQPATAQLPDLVSEVRDIDGWANNTASPTMGTPAGAFSRLAPAVYADGVSAPVSNRPNARLISNLVHDQTGSTPDPRGLSAMSWVWGQFIDHDMTHTPLQEGGETINIGIPSGDGVFMPGDFIPVSRSVFVDGTGTTSVRQQQQAITHYMDASNVYGGRMGEGTVRADWLRTGSGGRLETSTIDGDTYLPTISQKPGDPFMDGGPFGISDDQRYAAGDVRANEHSALTSMHTLMVREHNRVADALVAAGYTDDEVIYQAARKVVGATVQAVTYNEYLPSLGVSLGSYAGYDDETDVTITNEFATSGFRFAHSQIQAVTPRLNEDGSMHDASELRLVDGFWNPDKFLETGMDPLLRGLTQARAEAVDTQIIDDLRNMLFFPTFPDGNPVANGTDIAALDIIRGRDHGIGDLNSVRVALGLAPHDTFADLTGGDADVASVLELAYGDIGLVDLWTGILSETPMVGGSLGETATALLAEQFTRTRDGDRFFYLNDADFAVGSVLDGLGFGMDYFEGLSLLDVFRNNTGITGDLGVAGNVFFAAVVPEPTTMALLAPTVGLLLRRRRS